MKALAVVDAWSGSLFFANFTGFGGGESLPCFPTL